MIRFRNRTLRQAILENRAAIQDIENTLAASATGWVFARGRSWRVTPGSRRGLIEKKAHLELQVSEWEREELLEAWRGSSKDPDARTLIEKRLADLGVTLRKPTIDSQSADRTGEVVRSRNYRRHRPIDARKELISSLKAHHPNATARNICELIDRRINTTPSLKVALAPLDSWRKQAPDTRSWVDFYNHTKTRNPVRRYVNGVPALETAKSKR